MPELDGAPRKKFPPAMLAMNSLGDAFKDYLSTQGKSLLDLKRAYVAWGDFRDWLQADIKLRSPNNDVHLVYARTLPKYEGFQSWFYWAREKERAARLAEGDSIFKEACEYAELHNLTLHDAIVQVEQQRRMQR